jgi:hypothetical protein
MAASLVVVFPTGGNTAKSVAEVEEIDVIKCEGVWAAIEGSGWKDRVGK